MDEQENRIDRWCGSIGESNKDFHVLHFHEVRERPWRRNTGRPFPWFLPLALTSSAVLSSLGTIRTVSGLSHRRRLPGKKSATTATDAARYGSPVRRYTQRAGDRSIMLSGRFWNLASRDKIHCGRDAAMSRRQKTALEVRIARAASHESPPDGNFRISAARPNADHPVAGRSARPEKQDKIIRRKRRGTHVWVGEVRLGQRK